MVKQIFKAFKRFRKKNIENFTDCLLPNVRTEDGTLVQYLHSPNFPNDYDNNYDCAYYMDAIDRGAASAEYQESLLTFGSFSTEYGADFVTVIK